MKFFVTTPIYYVNDKPHIGHAYTTIIADTVARAKRLQKKDVFFLTGTDEHGQKIQEAAKKKNTPTLDYASSISARFKDLWDDFGISYDDFIRTTELRHKNAVQKAFLAMHKKGDIYKSHYLGHYCVSCETFFTQTQLVAEKLCPDCGKEVSPLQEESYFFKLSNYQDRLLKWYDSGDVILPKSRKNEVIKFVEGGLNDLSITRTSFDWGVQIPSELNDEKHVVYVWLDALMNYASALGYGTDDAKMHYFPADLHIIGKDILRFHAIFWPAFLMSLDLDLPKQVAAHGWWTRDGAKMSKSVGNVIDPQEVANAYGLDCFRFFLLREVPFGSDGDFAQKALIDRINNDLGKDLGNLLNRLLGMGQKYFSSSIKQARVRDFFGSELDKVDENIKQALVYFDEMSFSHYLEEIWKNLAIANKLITDVEPWAKMKQGGEDEVNALLGFLGNVLTKTALLLYPVMPDKMTQLAKSIDVEIDTQTYEKYITKAQDKCDFALHACDVLFPKIEKPLLVTKPIKKDETISIDEFLKIKIKIGTIQEAQIIEKSNKLILLKVDIGEIRQIVAGIKEFYNPSDLVGKQVCVLSNLKPTKIMGYESQGMLLAANDDKTLGLISPDKLVKGGSVVK